jgi:hypothetical protein
VEGKIAAASMIADELATPLLHKQQSITSTAAKRRLHLNRVLFRNIRLFSTSDGAPRTDSGVGAGTPTGLPLIDTRVCGEKNELTVYPVEITENFLTSPIFCIRVVKCVEGSNLGVIGGNCSTHKLFNHIKDCISEATLTFLASREELRRVGVVIFILSKNSEM